MPKIFIDDKEYEVKAGKNLLESILSLKLDLPYFCWHPAMGSVGACRQCAITRFKDENDKQGRLIMACMEPVQDNIRISINHPDAKEMRRHVIEWLMTNHPHDCPVCDEGGECHLQDMTLMTGHTYRNHRYKKRTYTNQYLGPFINHEMNRCIQCYRCVRFYRDYAGGRDFDVFSIHNTVYFGRHEEGTLENEFSGNLIEVCPTGVFTDKTLREHYTRKWDLTNAPSICHHCSIGCNTIASERYGSLRRILTRYNGKVNGYFLCDRGRFGYEFVNNYKRIFAILKKEKSEEKHIEIPEDIALNHLRKILSESKRIAAMGSPRASLESNFVLQKLAGKDNFFAGVNRVEHKLSLTALDILKHGSIRTPSLREMEQADAVFIIGEDLTNTAPMMALAMRQAARQMPLKKVDKLNIARWHDAAVREMIQDEKGPFFIATPHKTKLDDIAGETFISSPDDIIKFAFAVSEFISGETSNFDLTDDVKNLAKNVANSLINSDNPLIVSGTSLRNETILVATLSVANSLRNKGKNVQISFAFSECNSVGLSLLENKNLNDLFDLTKKEEIDTIIILENDLYRREEKNLVDEFFAKVKNIIVLDYLHNRTTEKADIVFPAGTFAESDGTLVNNEGRAQRFYQVYFKKEVKESWRWIKEFSYYKGGNGHEFSFYDIVQEMVNDIPGFKGIENLTPPPDYKIAGQKIPRQTHRFSGRTAMIADKTVHEPKPPEDPDSPLAFSMEGFNGEPPSSIIPFIWAPGWNSAQAINKYQIEVGGPLHNGDPGLRLFEPSSSTKIFDKKIPEFFEKRENEFLIFPLYHTFGSEELSNLSASVFERIPVPYLKMNRKDAEKSGLEEKKEISLKIGENIFNLQLMISDDLYPGTAGLPVGLPGQNYIYLPAYGIISKAAE